MTHTQGPHDTPSIRNTMPDQGVYPSRFSTGDLRGAIPSLPRPKLKSPLEVVAVENDS